MAVEAAIKAVRAELSAAPAASLDELHARIGWWTRETIDEALRALLAVKAARFEEGKFKVASPLDKFEGRSYFER